MSQEFANSDVAAGAQLLADVLTNGTHPPLVAGTIAAGDGAVATNEGECARQRLSCSRPCCGSLFAHSRLKQAS